MLPETLKSINETLSSLHREDFNLNDFTFFNPIRVALIASFFKRESECISGTSFEDMINSSDCQRYLGRIGLPRILGLKYSSPPWYKIKENLGVIELQDFSGDPMKYTFGADVKTSAKAKIKNQSEAFYSNLTKIVDELTGNIVDHSEAINTGVICGQFYEKKQALQIAIVDSGVGILKNINQKFLIGNSEQSAILKALEPGVTTGDIITKPYGNFMSNTGYGLTTSFNTMIANGADFIIGTSGGLIYYNSDRQQRLRLDIPKWEGTFIVINIYSKKEHSIEYEYILENLSK